MLGEADANKTRKQWEQNGVLVRLQSRIKRDKTLDAVMKEVQVKEEFVDRKQHIDNNWSNFSRLNLIFYTLLLVIFERFMG